MSMDLTGILNQNEYYTNHYFSSVFEDNARETIRQWQDTAAQCGEKTPWAKLNAIASRYFTLRDRANRLRSDIMLEPVVSELAFDVLTALGYPISAHSSKMLEVEPGVFVPVALELNKSNGAPALWVILCRNGSDEESIMDSVRFMTSWQGYDDEETGYSPEKTAEELTHMTNEELLSKVLFGMDEPPRWVLFVGLHQIALIDRNKWNEKRFLVFQLDDIFGRKEPTTMQAMSVLLHKDSLCPTEGSSLLDTLDTESHKHASGVSKDLKYALRECIELLGNEVVYDMKERQHVGVFGKALADDLTIQCLRYMYRILFMLFIEAKPELGYAPMKAETYALGYSFESLREIADNARADMDIERDGFYLKESMDLLFKLIYEGYPAGERDLLDEASVQGVFRIDPLKAHIFDPKRTELIEKARIRNGVLLDIIDKMSLTRGEKGKRRGRISYSNLGINQLGSVYEALLSYRGFFAEEDLYEVKRSGDTVDDLDVGYFVTERELDQYDEDERVRTGPHPTDPLRVHPKGEFIYRLAGREREKSASYYTPEVLTNCLVKYALKELLEGKTADEILQLTICEPAMGSAAFLNEAVTQMAEAYLTRKEKETGKSVPHEQRQQELQKIKMYIADRNVYGIDLNPVAVELAEVSLWLNTIYQGAYVPWFRTQIVNGNSLIGARRQCYNLIQLTAGKGGSVWHENAPERIEPGQKRKFAKQAYHFLMGDPGMCSYTDKVIKSLEPEKIAFIKDWNKHFCQPFSEEDCDRVLELSATIDQLWDAHVELRQEIAEKTTDPLSVWGQPEDTEHVPMTIREKDAIYESLYLSRGAENASPYARLKAVMDYWCALWFWPIDKAEELPTRQEFLFDVQMLLGMDVIRVTGDKKNKGQLSLFDFMPEEDPFLQEMLERYDRFGAVNLDRLRADFPRLRIANEIAQQQHFFHWELEFADVFAERGGFDLMIGNPPWIKMEWNEQAALSDSQPLFVIKKFTAPQTAKVRSVELKKEAVRKLYFEEYISIAATQSFLNSVSNYKSLKGTATNLYKYFLPQAWLFARKDGCSAFINQENIFDDAAGGLFRKELFGKIRRHYHFINELRLFSEVHHCTVYSLNVYSNSATGTFDAMFNLFTPETIEQAYNNEPNALYGMKDDDNNWNTKGNAQRLLKIGKRELSLFAQLFDAGGPANEARLAVIHASPLLKALKCFSDVEAYDTEIYSTLLWTETSAVGDGIIRKEPHMPLLPVESVLLGSNIFVNNPLFKSTRPSSVKNSDFDLVDLTQIHNRFLQRAPYKIVSEAKTYFARMPHLSWGERYSDQPRIFARKMVDPSGERTIISCLVPEGMSHTDGIRGIVIHDPRLLVLYAGLLGSVPYDFFAKTLHKENFTADTLRAMPIIKTEYENAIIARTLALNALTEHYAKLWQSSYSKGIKKWGWSKDDPRLNPSFFESMNEEWSPENALKSDYARRQAQVEIDVLVAMSLGMTLEDLKCVYRIVFSVMRKYENDTWYDRKGRIVFSAKNMGDLTYKRPEWMKIKEAEQGVFTREVTENVFSDKLTTRTIEYVAPFDCCDREKDYETAWAFFSKQK